MPSKYFEQTIKNFSLISLEAFKKLPTPRKLAYFKKKRGLENVGYCYCGCGERLKNDENSLQYYKECDSYVEEMRKILNECEHVD